VAHTTMVLSVNDKFGQPILSLGTTRGDIRLKAHRLHGHLPAVSHQKRWCGVSDHGRENALRQDPPAGNGRVERATAQSTNSTTNCPHAYACTGKRSSLDRLPDRALDRQGAFEMKEQRLRAMQSGTCPSSIIHDGRTMYSLKPHIPTRSGRPHGMTYRLVKSSARYSKIAILGGWS